MGSKNTTIVFGFDSAWTDNPKAPGAICAISYCGNECLNFFEPRLVSFSGALDFIRSERSGHAVSLVAIDQPTVVPNTHGSRPVDKVAGSLVSYVGGGVQPANRSKTKMFGVNAPIWNFLSKLDALQDPIATQSSSEGDFLIEVFPALALPSLNPRFAKRMSAPKYNPSNRRKFRQEDWRAVVSTVTKIASDLSLTGLADCSKNLHNLQRPKKADQDKLDAMICALVGIIWREKLANAAMLGQLISGYMITPVSHETRERLENAAMKQQTGFHWSRDHQAID